MRQTTTAAELAVPTTSPTASDVSAAMVEIRVNNCASETSDAREEDSNGEDDEAILSKNVSENCEYNVDAD